MPTLIQSSLLMLVMECCVIVGFDYHYISIESEQFTVTEWGRSELERGAVRFDGHHDMPVGYIAYRDDYEVHVNRYLGTTYARPNITVSATADDWVKMSGGIS